MRKIIAPLIAALLCSCGSGKPIVCDGSLSPKNLTETQRSAVQDALAKTMDRCRPEIRNCDVRVTSNDNGEILIGVHFLVPSESSGTCAQVIGDETLFVYGKDGQYMESLPGM